MTRTCSLCLRAGLLEIMVHRDFSGCIQSLLKQIATVSHVMPVIPICKGMQPPVCLVPCLAAGGDYHRHQQDMDANEDDDGTVQAVLTVAKTGASVSQQGRTPTAFSNDLQPPQTDTASTLKPSGLDWHRLHKRLFGWVPKHQKMNGKRLVPDNKITYKFMVSKTV